MFASAWQRGVRKYQPIRYICKSLRSAGGFIWENPKSYLRNNSYLQGSKCVAGVSEEQRKGGCGYYDYTV